MKVKTGKVLAEYALWRTGRIVYISDDDHDAVNWITFKKMFPAAPDFEDGLKFELPGITTKKPKYV